MSLDSSSAISYNTVPAVQHVNENLIPYIIIYSLQLFLNILCWLKGLFVSHNGFNYLDSNFKIYNIRYLVDLWQLLNNTCNKKRIDQSFLGKLKSSIS